MLPEDFQCYLVTKDAGQVAAKLTRLPLSALPPGDVLIRVAYSSLNYKDALAARGQAGIVRAFPHVPGVDAAGEIAATGVYEWVEGDRVLATGFDLGAACWGGLAEYVSVPQDWVLPLPPGLSLRESMVLGTAGVTAALSIDALQKHGLMPESGEVVVTGATGGVGSMAVAILARLGYHVAAVTGKPQAHDYLIGLGAARIVARQALDDRGGKPLLHEQWAGAVDTVGGNILASVIRATRHSGCVAACGLTAGSDLPLTVFPFILRGVTLAGIDAAFCPLALKHEAWRRLAGPWKPEQLDAIATEIELAELPDRIDEMLAGRAMGRVVVRIGGDDDARDL